jgi:hypothetical protein
VADAGGDQGLTRNTDVLFRLEECKICPDGLITRSLRHVVDADWQHEAQSF